MLPYTLLLFRCEHDPLERLNDRLRQYRVESVHTLPDAEQALRELQPDALIAPINAETLNLFLRIEAEDETPTRPVLVLIAETPKSGLPADLVLPARWLEQALSSQLRLRADNIDLHRHLAEEMGVAAMHMEAQKRAVREIDLLKNAIVRTVSHELKTPLLHVKSAVAMLSEDQERDRHTLVGYATEATARLEVAVKNVTQLADALDIELEPAQVGDAVEQAVRNLSRIWEQKENLDRIRVSVPRHLPLVWADKTAVGVALQHLVDNGLKFSKKPVEVSAKVDDERVVIAVKDRGIGIPQDKLDEIFDPFYQVESLDNRRFGGLGVGLSIVRLILERHHATINVESVVGKGSTFSFTLPCLE